ncbi:MAG TPA: hypothetical protein VG838_09165 [Opitutaceae bacterium]|nr:hypothetical protein [Opitutaceae bacterium]
MNPTSTHAGGFRPPQRPAWQRIHRSPVFWLAAFFIMLAMTIYVMTDNFAIRPGQKLQRPVPAVAP